MEGVRSGFLLNGTTMSSSPRKSSRSVPVRVGLAVAAIAILIIGMQGIRSLSTYRATLLASLDLGRSGAPLAPANPGPSADPAKSALIFVGDSRIESWPTPPSLAGAHIINLGRNGETTAQLLARLDADIIQREPRMVVLQTGINDLKAMGVFRSRANEIAKNCWGNLRQIIDRLRASNIPVVVLTIFPVGELHPLRYPIWSNETLTAVADINERLRRIDEPGVLVFDCDPIFSDDGRMRAEFIVDDFHINPAAYQALSAQLTPFLTDTLERGRDSAEL